MVGIRNPYEELMKRTEERSKQVKELTSFVDEGYISERLGAYTQELLVLNQLSDEIEVYIELRNVNSALESLTEMKNRLDFNVGAILLADGKIKSKMVDGISCLANPNFKNVTKYKELYDFAQEIYDESKNKLNTLLEQPK